MENIINGTENIINGMENIINGMENIINGMENIINGTENGNKTERSANGHTVLIPCSANKT